MITTEIILEDETPPGELLPATAAHGRDDHDDDTDDDDSFLGDPDDDEDDDFFEDDEDEDDDEFFEDDEDDEEEFFPIGDELPPARNPGPARVYGGPRRDPHPLRHPRR